MRRDDRISEILARCHERRARGEAVDVAEILDSHPDLAGELRLHLGALELLDEAVAEADLLPAGAPREIGDYRILREIGRGGMGVVYEAEQVSLRRRVALKVLSLAITGTEQAVKRFQREARAAGRLHHTNVVPIHAMGQHAGYWYYTMELVEGRSLRQVIAELKGLGRREESLARLAASGAVADTRESDAKAATGTGERAYFLRVAEMFAGVADALQLAHKEGVIHRDIKPSNLLLDANGTVKIVDFGLARLEGEGPSMTVTGDLLGTPAYMSPEQAMAKRIAIDHRTDIYSLGATLYEVLTLRPPFRGKTLQEVCSEIITKDPELPRRTNRRIPRDLETVVLKAMEKDRDKRYRTAGEFARDLRRFADGTAIQARRIGPLGRSWRRLKRHKVRSALVGAVLLLGVAGGILAVRASSEAAARLELDYARHCALAEAAMAAPDRETTGGQLPHLAAVGVSARELYSRAIEILSDRPEAYLGRALTPGATSDQRDEDLEQALHFGLPRRTYHLARAYVRSMERRQEEAERERERAQQHPRGGPLDLYFEARLLAQLGKAADALELLREAIGSARRGSAVHYVALRYRGELRAQAGQLAEALADLHGVQALGDESAGIRIRIASLWRHMGKGNTAEGLFAEAVREVREQDLPAAWLDLCRACETIREDAWHEQVSEEALRHHPESVDLLVERSIARRRSGEVEEALDLCARALDLAPRHHKAHEAKGDALHRLERRREAVEAYDLALESDPRCLQAHYNRAVSLLDMNRFAEALEGFGRALELAPAFAPAWTGRGISLQGLGDIDGARATIERAIELDDGHPQAHNALGSLLCDELGRYEDALAAFDRALALDPKYASALHNRGNALSQLGRNEQALEAFTRAAELDPDFRDAHWSRGLTLARLGKHEEALEAYDRALEIDPRDLRSLRDKGVSLDALGRHRDALALYDLAIGIDETFADAHHNRGNVLARLHRLADALKAFERAIELAPGDTNPAYGKANVLLALDELDDALEAYDAVLDLDPNHAGAHNNRGWVLRQQGRHEEAVASFRRAVELDPKSPWGPYNLGVALVLLGRYEDALAEFGRAHDLDPREPQYLVERGNALRRLRRYDEALEAYGLAVDLNSKHAYALYSRALLFREMQRYEEALAGFEFVIREIHDFQDNLTERARMLALLGRFDDAWSALRPAIEHRWDGLPVLQPHWECLWILGRYEDALHVAGRLVAHDPACVDRQVACLRALGRPAEAKRTAASAAQRVAKRDERLRLAYVRAVAGDREAAHALLESWDLPWQPEDLFERARVHAALDEKEAALSWLERAVVAGLRRPAGACPDPEFAPLTDQPRYAELRADMARR